jgi:hypothetical protein
MSDDVTAQTAGAEEFVGMSRILIGELAGQVRDPRAAGLTDWEVVRDLTSVIPADVTVLDLKLYLSVAVLMLAEERSEAHQ